MAVTVSKDPKKGTTTYTFDNDAHYFDLAAMVQRMGLYKLTYLYGLSFREAQSLYISNSHAKVMNAIFRPTTTEEEEHAPSTDEGSDQAMGAQREATPGRPTPRSEHEHHGTRKPQRQPPDHQETLSPHPIKRSKAYCRGCGNRKDASHKLYDPAHPLCGACREKARAAFREDFR